MASSRDLDDLVLLLFLLLLLTFFSAMSTASSSSSESSSESAGKLPGGSVDFALVFLDGVDSAALAYSTREGTAVLDFDALLFFLSAEAGGAAGAGGGGGGSESVGSSSCSDSKALTRSAILLPAAFLLFMAAVEAAAALALDGASFHTSAPAMPLVASRSLDDSACLISVAPGLALLDAAASGPAFPDFFAAK